MKLTTTSYKAARSMVDDVRMGTHYGYAGAPIRFSNEEFRKMFNLAGLGKDDILYDLGSGWGQSLIIALTEYGVKKAVGIERNSRRRAVSISRLKERRLEGRGRVVLGNFENLFSDQLAGAHLEEPTVIFYGLSTYSALIDAISEKARLGCRLIYYFNGLFPEIKPTDSDFPFYLYTKPFEKPVSEYDWLSSIIHKRRSTVQKSQRPSVEELWAELSHDCHVYTGDVSFVQNYKRRLKKVLGKSRAGE